MMVKKFNPFYILLKTEVQINITSDLKETSDAVEKALSDASELGLKQPIPGKQLVLMTDARFRSAVYALMIEDTPDQKEQSKRKTYIPLAFGSINSSPPNSKCLYTQKKLWQTTWYFLSSHINCGKQPDESCSDR